MAEAVPQESIIKLRFWGICVIRRDIVEPNNQLILGYKGGAL